KNVAIFKNIGLGLIFLFAIISCEKDFEDIAIDLVGNKAFSVGDTLIEIISYNKNIESSRVDNNNDRKLPLSLLGVNQDNDFGHIKSALISQLNLPILGVIFGDNATIDQVILDIPYFATRDENQDAIDPDTGDVIEDEDGNAIQVPNFKIDSIYGNTEQEFNITINELGTFLNTLDPQNPSRGMKYYSDKVYEIKDQLFSDDFLADRNDTILYINRDLVIIGIDENDDPIYDIDTVKADDSNPSMKFSLDKNFFKTRFIDHEGSSDFENNFVFHHYFRGLYVDANGSDGTLLNLSTLKAKMTIYYTNDITKDEGADEDLNFNGVKGETDVVIKTKQSMHFIMGGVRTGNYTRDYNKPEIINALDNPNMDDGEKKLFVQGASGSEAIIDLFPSIDDLYELRQKGWLINEANVTIYIDGDQDEVPSSLYLYNEENGSMLPDYYTFNFGPEVYGGLLEYDDEGNPEKYKFRITKYVKDILDEDDPKKSSKLALKNFVNTDGFDPQVLDTLVADYNWIPKGVVLKGNLPDTDMERIKLEIYYSKSKFK
ncbi:MAG: DUF4270 domain-containing protein, partial [Flavobacteriaceae bacterium]|nr:DUF4270 domain-containing protein [Flavobacteriaceae bacterium]